jgi:AcrR family transcriptional regulator
MEQVLVRVSRTQEERASATRARLIEATLALLLSKGYAAATMVDISAHASLSRGALSHHYESKDELGRVDEFDQA